MKSSSSSESKAFSRSTHSSINRSSDIELRLYSGNYNLAWEFEFFSLKIQFLWSGFNFPKTILFSSRSQHSFLDVVGKSERTSLSKQTKQTFFELEIGYLGFLLVNSYVLRRGHFEWPKMLVNRIISNFPFVSTFQFPGSTFNYRGFKCF